MRGRFALGMLAGVLLGVAATLAGATISGGWFEYRQASTIPDAESDRLRRGTACEPIERGTVWLKCPRFTFWR